MKTLLLRSLAAGSLATTLILGAAGTASAAPSRATLKAAADTVVNEVVGGSNYGKVKAKYPTALNFTNDGCSVPAYIIAASPALYGVLRAYGSVFEKSCDRHDFGYRNYGKNTTTPGVHPKFDPTSARKKSIDSRFYSNMKKQCDDKYGNPITTAACKVAAKTFYTAVDKAGGKAFFG
ncbi:MAG: phospholipase A2 [Nakamurella sp.]